MRSCNRSHISFFNCLNTIRILTISRLELVIHLRNELIESVINEKRETTMNLHKVFVLKLDEIVICNSSRNGFTEFCWMFSSYLYNFLVRNQTKTKFILKTLF